MFDTPIVAGMLILAVFALGEFVSIITRARVPMLFVVMIGYLILLWTGIFPKDIVDKANFTAFASILPALLIVHMGTLIPIKQLKEQYKAVFIALAGIVVATLLIFAVCAPILGYTEAVSGIGPLVGGTIAYIITSEKLTELGLTAMVTIPALILAIQGLIGMPLANFFLRKRGLAIVKSLRENGTQEVAATVEATNLFEKKEESKKSFLPKKYQTHVILLFQVFLGAALATWLGNVTHINYSLWALAIGLIGSYFGFYVGSIMERANSFGILITLLMVLVMSSMSSITPSMFTGYLPEVAFIMVVGIVGILIGGFIVSKLVKWDPNKGMPVAITALFGFPGDYILCEEVSRSVSKNEAEQKAVFNELLTPMLVGGFTTVTVASVVIAGIVMSTL
ncbi:hypothetical protein OEV98_05670 [Caldibacillus lycopersici]|uniref:Uncharacterized protein n=1 Tax=Perspicuibacillus lycopersici TaxID=1325689 RepID=A0AAE3IRT4_9BACI|nr:hypothetical protein [Perspicuibacillus lycopersici]MCU9613037.1 hypothetical protein [Perspicuibacillus lycopersici]